MDIEQENVGPQPISTPSASSLPSSAAGEAALLLGFAEGRDAGAISPLSASSGGSPVFSGAESSPRTSYADAALVHQFLQQTRQVASDLGDSTPGANFTVPANLRLGGVALVPFQAGGEGGTSASTAPSKPGGTFSGIGGRGRGKTAPTTKSKRATVARPGGARHSPGRTKGPRRSQEGEDEEQTAPFVPSVPGAHASLPMFATSKQFAVDTALALPLPSVHAVMRTTLPPQAKVETDAVEMIASVALEFGCMLASESKYIARSEAAEVITATDSDAQIIPGLTGLHIVQASSGLGYDSVANSLQKHEELSQIPLPPNSTWYLSDKIGTQDRATLQRIFSASLEPHGRFGARKRGRGRGRPRGTGAPRGRRGRGASAGVFSGIRRHRDGEESMHTFPDGAPPSVPQETFVSEGEGGNEGQEYPTIGASSEEETEFPT